MTKTPATILVIDDDPDFRLAVTAILASAGHKVIAASGPEEGKARLLADRPDLVLLDIMMDSLFDGYALCHAVKTSEEFAAARETPILFVSAVKDIAGARFGFGEGGEGLSAPDDYLDKPVKPEDLLARVERFLAK
ncbi:MAG: response regulator [Candidatus Aminicenantes bacterium]|nr:response regulator [Candidatus Aminicenantes bacterium]